MARLPALVARLGWTVLLVGVVLAQTRQRTPQEQHLLHMELKSIEKPHGQGGGETGGLLGYLRSIAPVKDLQRIALALKLAKLKAKEEMLTRTPSPTPAGEGYGFSQVYDTASSSSQPATPSSRDVEYAELSKRHAARRTHLIALQVRMVMLKKMELLKSLKQAQKEEFDNVATEAADATGTQQMLLTVQQGTITEHIAKLNQQLHDENKLKKIIKAGYDLFHDHWSRLKKFIYKHHLDYAAPRATPTLRSQLESTVTFQHSLGAANPTSKPTASPTQFESQWQKELDTVYAAAKKEKEDSHAPTPSPTLDAAVEHSLHTMQRPSVVAASKPWSPSAAELAGNWDTKAPKAVNLGGYAAFQDLVKLSTSDQPRPQNSNVGQGREMHREETREPQRGSANNNAGGVSTNINQDARLFLSNMEKQKHSRPAAATSKRATSQAGFYSPNRNEFNQLFHHGIETGEVAVHDHHIETPLDVALAHTDTPKEAENTALSAFHNN